MEVPAHCKCTSGILWDLPIVKKYREESTLLTCPLQWRKSSYYSMLGNNPFLLMAHKVL